MNLDTVFKQFVIEITILFLFDDVNINIVGCLKVEKIALKAEFMNPLLPPSK